MPKRQPTISPSQLAKAMYPRDVLNFENIIWSPHGLVLASHYDNAFYEVVVVLVSARPFPRGSSIHGPHLY
jgi:hypothetical protein